MKRRSKIFQERAASGGTCFIYKNVGDDSVFQPDRFHVLTADIQDKGCVLHIFLRGSGMGYRLHRMIFRLKSIGKKLFPIPGGSRRKDMKPQPLLPVAFPHFNQGPFRHIQRNTLIRGVKGVQNFFLLIDQNKFCGSAS